MTYLEENKIKEDKAFKKYEVKIVELFNQQDLKDFWNRIIKVYLENLN